MGQYDELRLLQQILGGANLLSWLRITLLAGLLAAILFKQERIVAPTMFKLAYIFLALSIAVPALTDPITMSIGRQGPFDLRTLLFTAAGPVLFALSLICAFTSMMPRPGRATRTPPATPHPLD